MPSQLCYPRPSPSPRTHVVLSWFYFECILGSCSIFPHTRFWVVDEVALPLTILRYLDNMLKIIGSEKENSGNFKLANVFYVMHFLHKGKSYWIAYMWKGIKSSELRLLYWHSYHMRKFSLLCLTPQSFGKRGGLDYTSFSGIV